MTESSHSAEGDDLSLQEVTRRVQKLIAVAERTTHPDESDAFSRKAAELIARYRLSAEALRPSTRRICHSRVGPRTRGTFEPDFLCWRGC